MMVTEEVLHQEAAREIYGSCLLALRDERGVHAETAIAALAAVCGEALLRASNVDLSQFPQGGIVLVDQVNDSGPRTLAYLEELLTELDIRVEEWQGKIPLEHQPIKDPARLAQELRPLMQSLYEKFQLDEKQAAQAVCLALALLIRDCRTVLEPEISVIIASNTVSRMSRSVPLV